MPGDAYGTQIWMDKMDEGTETWAKVKSPLLLTLTWGGGGGVGERGKQKERKARGYEVGTCWNVQRVCEKLQSPIY
jgi:hypothetical protein